MSKSATYYERFKRETLYLWEEENETYIKSVPGKGYFSKSPGRQEQPIAPNTDTVTRAIEAKREVTKEEYEKA